MTTEGFTWNHSKKEAYIEASQIGKQLPNILNLESHRTGKIAEFHYYRTLRDGEGEVTSFVYLGSGELGGWKLNVFND